MPTPIGHILAGETIHQFSLLRAPQPHRRFLFAVLLFSVLPDIDFLFGFPAGDINRYHHLFTHSLLFVMVAGAVGGLLIGTSKKERLFFSAVFALVGTSHLLLDCLATDRRPPFGCPLLWPVWNRFFIAPITIFSDVSRPSEPAKIFIGIFNMYNLRTVLIEIGLLAPLCAAAAWFRARMKRV